ncbi:MAG: ABC transporter permease [Oligoflexia bacterium]|nr:ABC transporter permease [Oligoflexia bacterium]
MPKKDLLITPFLFFFYRDISRVFKVKVQTIFAPLISQTLYLIIFGVSLGRVVEISDQFSYLEFIIPGLVALALINQSFQNGSSSIFTMKITGEIIDIKSTALNTQQIIFAIACSGLLRGAIVSCLTLLIGELFHFYFEGGFLPLHSLLWFMAFLSSGGVVFALLGFSVGVWSRSFDHIGAISSFVILPLIYLGGVWFDLDTLSPFWQKISVFNPLLYFINGIRYSFLGVSDIPVVQAFFIVFLSLFVTYTLAYFMVFKGSFQRAF